MKTLQKYFPLAFTEKPHVTGLVLYIILHIIGLVIVNIISALFAVLLAFLPILLTLFQIIFGIIDLYLVISSVLCILDYFKILEIKS